MTPRIVCPLNTPFSTLVYIPLPSAFLLQNMNYQITLSLYSAAPAVTCWPALLMSLLMKNLC